ncbi:MAG: hypothetical protein HQ506_03595 [Candidatus Marinimicrobia bacterium]|nr:hypothetical protein [Candidatus Neomarinimicrobiota bacterium]
MELRRAVSGMFMFATILVGTGFCQNENDLISGPLSGVTFAPEPGHLGLTVQYISTSSTSSFDSDGKEHDLNEYNERIADPGYKRSMSALRGEYTISKNLGLFVIIPFVNSQELEWNLEPTYMGALNDLSGQTGVGDIMVGGWFQVVKSSQLAVNISGAYYMATGSSPDETTTAELGSTGNGHTSTGAGISADFVVSSKILLSLGGEYVLNQEADYSFDDVAMTVEYGNEMLLGGRLTYSMSNNLSLGMNADYLASDKMKVDGQESDDTEATAVILTPMIGHHDTTNKLNMRISGGYQLTYAGSNILKYDGLRFGLYIIF